MKIVKDDGLKYVKFEDIQLGECFKNMNHDYFIKIPFIDDKQNYKINSVDLRDGCVCFFTDETNVIKIDATIRVEE